MSLCCSAQFEADVPRRGTHTCQRAEGHPEPTHFCPVCGCLWTSEGVIDPHAATDAKAGFHRSPDGPAGTLSGNAESDR